MSQKIVMKKFGIFSIPANIENFSNEAYQKSKQRIVKTTKQRHSNRLFYVDQDNFKSNWLCKSCFKIFRLKSNRNFKTLQVYNLTCQHCQSENITHIVEFLEAINNHVSISEIIKTFKEQDIELEFTVNNKSKYFAIVIS
jgi:transcription elongation factor Elf1